LKILFVPYGSVKAPATRYRVSQIIPLLEKENIGCAVFSSISGFSTKLMLRSPEFSMPGRVFYYIYVFVERIVRFFPILMLVSFYDVIFLQRTTFSFGLEKLLALRNKNIVFDIDDAIYLTDSESGGILTRIKKFFKENEVIGMLKVASTVIVENDYIKNFVSGYCGNVLKIPGPIDTDRFAPAVKEPREKVIVGWIGSPATTVYLHMLDGVFKALSDKYDFVEFRFIGAGRYDNPGIRYEIMPWAYDTEVALLRSFDIGVMPMPDDAWTRGKLGCKMLQYMALGIPALVSYTPTNAEMIEDGVNGYFASSDREWISRLSLLIEDRALRGRIGGAGRDTVVAKCSLRTNIGRYVKVFSGAYSHDSQIAKKSF